MRVSSLRRRRARVPAVGAALAIASVTGAACGSSAPHALGSVDLSLRQAQALARSQFSAEDRQAATVLSPQPGSFLAGKDTVTVLGSTTAGTLDTLPHGIWPVTRTIGSVTAGDVLVDDFGDRSSQPGTGTSIMDVHPDGQVDVFASIPRTVTGCPGGVGLTTALVQLETGWVLVGSLPTVNGEIATAKPGCVLELSSTGVVVGTISGAYLDGPWGETVRDNGSTATLFVSNTLVGITRPSITTVDRGDVVRLSLSQSQTTRPEVTAEVRVAGGFPERTNPTALVQGPSGLALGSSGMLYVADTVGDRIVSIPDALTSSGSIGPGTTLSKGGQLAGPVGLALAPNGDLLTTNSTNGKVVEVTASGRQVGEYYADEDVDQNPPGDGELSGVSVDRAGTGVLFAKDEANTLDLLH